MGHFVGIILVICVTLSFVNRARNFRIYHLMKTGFYQWVGHPFYLSFICITASLVLILKT